MALETSPEHCNPDEGTIHHVLAFYDKAADEWQWWEQFIGLMDTEEGRKMGAVFCAMWATRSTNVGNEQ